MNKFNVGDIVYAIEKYSDWENYPMSYEAIRGVVVKVSEDINNKDHYQYLIKEVNSDEEVNCNYDPDVYSTLIYDELVFNTKEELFEHLFKAERENLKIMKDSLDKYEKEFNEDKKKFSENWL